MRTAARGVSFAWLLVTAASALANDATYTDLSVGTGRETRSGNSADWTSSYIDLLHQFSPRKSIALRVSTQQRFGLRDNAITLSTYWPVGAKTTLFVEAINSSQHQFLVRDSWQVQVAHALDAGFGVAVGVREARYLSANNSAGNSGGAMGDGKARVTIGEFTIERYFSRYRAAFSVSPSQSSLAGNAMSTRFTFAQYYGIRSNVQLVLAQGTELDRINANTPVIAAKVRAVTVYGRHALTDVWSLDYAIGRSRRADVNHNQFNVGATLRFR
jgi:YaiO family outer membrane protein